MSHLPRLLNDIGRLLTYPEESTVRTAEFLYIVLQGELIEAAKEAARFGAYLEQHSQEEVEETFTRTFDVNPLSALEVGWHLFGEEYARGMFLVRMREELRRYGIPESVELPDHLSQVLAVVAAMPEQEAARFVRACVQPAVEKMNSALANKESPYRHVIACLAVILRYVWGEPSAEEGNPRHEVAGPAPSRNAAPFMKDPLHAFPVADVGCGCGSGCSGCSGEIEVVPLRIEPSPAADPVVPEELETSRIP